VGHKSSPWVGRTTVEIVVAIAAKHSFYGGTSILEPPFGGDAIGFFEHVLTESDFVVWPGLATGLYLVVMHS
jgi:hypothetical protein